MKKPFLANNNVYTHYLLSSQ